MAFRVYGRNAALQRVLAHQSRRIPALAALRRAQEAEIHAAVERILSSAPGIQLPDVKVGAYFVTLFIESLIDDSVLHGEQARAFEENRIVDAAADRIVRYALGRVDP